MRKAVKPFVLAVYTSDPSSMSLASLFPPLGELSTRRGRRPRGPAALLPRRETALQRGERPRPPPRARTPNRAGRTPGDRCPGPGRDGPSPATTGPCLRSPRERRSRSGGVRALPEAALAALGEDVCKLGWEAVLIRQRHAATTATSSADVNDGYTFDVRFETPEGEPPVRAHTVVVATPSKISASLLDPLAPARRASAA